MVGLNRGDPNSCQVATGMLQDGWTCDVQRMPSSDKFVATVVHPYGDELLGGVPWPIEDPSLDTDGLARHPDTAHPTYLSIGESMSGAQRYVEILSELRGYPDPHKMSARGLRPTLLPTECSSQDERGAGGAGGAGSNVSTAHLMSIGITGIEVTPVVIRNEDLPTVIFSKMEDAERQGKDIQILHLQTRIIELEAALEAGNIDVQFAILNRAGINHRWHRRPAEADTVIFFDLDRIHDHNERWGYEVTDNHIRAVMSQINHYWIFRWYSGDEFGLLCAAADAGGFADRVKALLKEQGMTATFGIAPILDDDLEKSLGRAASLVQEAKAKGIRGVIFEA